MNRRTFTCCRCNKPRPTAGSKFVLHLGIKRKACAKCAEKGTS